MKKSILLSLAGIIVMLGFVSSAIIEENYRKSYGEVEQIEGYYIFVNCKPLNEYNYLGSVKFANTLGLSGDQFTDVRDKLIKRAKKDYPKADALIFQFSSGAADKCDAVMFK